MYSTTQTTWKRRKWGKNFEHLSGRGGRDTRSTFKIRPAWYWTRALAANFPYQELFFALLWRASLVLCAFSVAARPFCAVLQLLIIFLQPVEERDKLKTWLEFRSHHWTSSTTWSLQVNQLTNFFWASSIFRLFSARINSNSSRFFFSSSYKMGLECRMLIQIGKCARKSKNSNNKRKFSFQSLSFLVLFFRI